MSIPLLEVPGVYRSNRQPFRVMNLLGSSAKTEKGKEWGWETPILFLAPDTQAYTHWNNTGNGRAIVRAVAERFRCDYDAHGNHGLTSTLKRTVCSHADN